MNIFAISGLFNFLIISILGIIVYWRNKAEEANKRYILFCFSLAFWSLNYFFWQISRDEQTALFFSRALIAGVIFVAILLFHFVLVLTNLVEQKKPILRFGYYFFSFFFILNFTPYFVKGVAPKLFFPYWPEPAVAFMPYLLVWMGYFIYSMLLLFQGYRNESGIKKVQYKYCFLAIVIGGGGGLTNYFLWYDIPVAPYGNFIFSALPGIMAYVILKYNLFSLTPEIAGQLIIKTIPEFLIVLDTDLNIVFVNHKFFDDLGYANEKLYGKPISAILPEATKAADLMASVRERKLNNFEIDYLSKDGRKIPVSINSLLLKEKRGFAAGVVMIGRDMSEIKTFILRLEQERESVKKINQELAELNNEFKRKINEIEKINTLMVDRELKMVDLKNEVDSLLTELGRSAKYRKK